MKRGLVVLDPAETPAAEWEGRVRALQQSLASTGVDVALVYGDVSRSDDIAYLTNLCIYWNEGVLAVPADGPPAFLTKLSLRVQNWMKRSSTVTEFAGGRNFAELVAAYLGERPAGTLGLVEGGLWPADVVDEIVAAVPAWRVERLGGLVREQRLAPSDAETALLRHAGGVLSEALAGATVEAGPGGRFETVERTVRGAGFLDVHPVSTTTADGVASFGVTGQYRTVWVHACRVLGDGPGDWPGALRAAFAAAVGAASAGAREADLAAAARQAGADLPPDAGIRARWVDQADLGTGGELRVPDPDRTLATGAVGAVCLDLDLPGGGHAALADTVRITGGAPELLT